MASRASKETKLGVIDLFSGVGGLSLGAARAGFSLNGAVEIDPHALSAHRQNFPTTIHLSESVSKLNGAQLRQTFELANGSLAGIIGGPPCQGFSSIGKREISDPRNDLFSSFFRIVSEAKPKFFLAENVPGILNEQYDHIRKKAFSYVKDTYELLRPIKICARDFGAPTTRTRVFFYGYLKNEMDCLEEENFKPPAHIEPVTVGDALKGLPLKIKPNWQLEEHGWRIARSQGRKYFHVRLRGNIPTNVGDPLAVEKMINESRASGCLGTLHSKKVAFRYDNVECGKTDPISKSYRLDPKGFCPTIRAGTDSTRGSYQAVRPIHPTEPRVITPREAARLQGFPDWFRFAPSKWHSFRQIGNSVSPILAERLLYIIRKALGD